MVKLRIPTRSRPPVRTLVVVAHPVDASFISSLAKAAIESRCKRSGEVRVIELYAESFDPLLSQQDWLNKENRTYTAAVHRDHVEMLRWATSLVLVYPTWFGGFPAMLKGWLDRVWAVGVAYEIPENRKRIRRGLTNIREIVVVTTHGSSKRMNMAQGEPGRQLVRRGLRVLCHPLCRVRWVAFYGNDTASPQQRADFRRRVGDVLVAR